MVETVQVWAGRAGRQRRAGLRRMMLATAVVDLVQAGLGMVVNLYVTVPARHPGAKPSSYFTGSYHSVVWALSHSPAALASHAGLGFLLGLMALTVAVRSIALRAGWIGFWSVLALLLVAGAGFNGASFLDYGGLDLNSLLMALFALGAACCYFFALYLLSA